MDGAGFDAAAAALGMRVDAGDPDLRVVLTDDYLRGDLAEINRGRLDDGGAWMLVKPVGSVVWIGPVFEPGRTGCWQCMSTYLETHQILRRYLRQRSGAGEPPVVSVADLPATRRMAAEMAALHAAKWLAGFNPGEPGAGESVPAGPEIFTLNTARWHGQRHVLHKRPQCPACGDPEIQQRLQRAPVRLGSRLKVVTSDGGHRASTPETLLSDYESMISPITGPVPHLTPTSPAEGLHTYLAGANMAVAMADVGALRAGLRQSAGGKGMTDVQAKASALAEAIERYSGVYRGDEATISATMSELGDAAIHPNALQLFSDRQFADRAAWNAKQLRNQHVCDPFDPARRTEWTPVWSLSRDTTRHLPTAALFYGYPLPCGGWFAAADSNGNAAGSCVEDAVLQGFLELVERDSVAVWWYNMVRRPGIDLASFDEPYFQRWQQRYRSIGRETWALDVTTDLGIPTVVAVSRRVDQPQEDLVFAFGAHFDVKIAISRALTEMNQFLNLYTAATGELQHWLRSATVGNQPYLLSAEDQPLRVAADYRDPTTDDLAEDIALAQRIVENAGMELLVLDQTRPDIGLPVVKVIVPGMRHFWTRYAPGRLYDVPVRLGWLSEPTPETELNPIGMFL
ncbi:TOMM precursor leader peptide-binding protein [Nocardia panacis]|uniref:TOMM precursor leader peptide-binding protein n=1 Tax=Nocardia panacis TaxID=2340916 RepID=UPI00193A78D8|nr:TOMM precursor leader peptide-binding protein [Nocardia panacis]